MKPEISISWTNHGFSDNISVDFPIEMFAHTFARVSNIRQAALLGAFAFELRRACVFGGFEEQCAMIADELGNYPDARDLIRTIYDHLAVDERCSSCLVCPECRSTNVHVVTNFGGVQSTATCKDCGASGSKSSFQNKGTEE